MPSILREIKITKIDDYLPCLLPRAMRSARMIICAVFTLRKDFTAGWIFTILWHIIFTLPKILSRAHAHILWPYFPAICKPGYFTACVFITILQPTIFTLPKFTPGNFYSSIWADNLYSHNFTACYFTPP